MLKAIADLIDSEVPKAKTQDGREALQRAVALVYEAIASEAAPEPTGKACADCGERLFVDATFCPACELERPRKGRSVLKRNNVIDSLARDVADAANETLCNLLNESGLDELEEVQEFSFEVMKKVAKKILCEE